LKKKGLTELIEFLNQHGIQEFEWTNGDKSIRLGKGAITTISTPPATSVTSGHSFQPPSTDSKPSQNPVKLKGNTVTSPFVGTFFRSPSPTASTFVEVGQKVNKGDVLCIIEAMKIMNEIESEISGTVIEIFAEDGQPVEFGEGLFVIG